jgi:pseudouridylate synthase / pseudouridine kinase
MVFFNPIPRGYALPQSEMEEVIQKAVREGEDKGVSGKSITPYLLKRIATITKGRSLKANFHLVVNNAAVAAKIACDLSSFNRSSLEPTTSAPVRQDPLEPDTANIVSRSGKDVVAELSSLTSPFTQPTESGPVSQAPSGLDTANIVVIGSMAVDLTCKFSDMVSKETMKLLHTSYPSEMHTSVGGVGHNVALAASYASTDSVRLITAIGDDPDGALLHKYAQASGLDVSSASADTGTARCVAIHDRDGELITAAADMTIIERVADADIRKEIRRARPKWLAFDGNLSPSAIKTIIEETPETKGTLLLFKLMSPV